MAVNPSVLNISYKQFTNSYNTSIINYIEPIYHGTQYGRHIIVDYGPDWIAIDRQSDGEGRVTIRQSVNNMSPGTHVRNVFLRMSTNYEDPFNPGQTITEIHDLGPLEIRLNVIATIKLAATPSPITFNYTLGSPAPEPILVSIASESAWTVSKTKTWVTLSTGSGNGMGSVTTSVEAAGLAVGTHTDTLTFIDGLFTLQVLLTLTITEADTETTFLYVQPSTMTINYTTGGYLPKREIELNASGNWTATASEPWIELEQNSGFAGVAFFNLTLVQAEALALSEGVHLATVVFEQGGLVKTIYVTLNVYKLVESLLNDTDLYFTDDNNMIILSSLREDTFLALEMSSSFESNVTTGQFAIPFYASRGERRIGSFPKKVIGARPMLMDLDQVKLFSPYTAALINLIITEEDIISDQVFQTVPVNNVQFIKGQTPALGWMSEMPNVRFLTKKGIAAFSFLSNGNIANQITVTGDVSATFNFTNALNRFFTAMLPMEKLPGLQVGHEINISVLGYSLKVHIAPEGQDHCSIFWENKWGCFDTFECTGEVEVDADFDISTSKLRKDYRQTETKTLSVENKNAFKINTGWVRSHDEIIGLTNLLQASNIYVLYNGVLSKVNNATRKLKLSETNREEPSFDLTFDNAIS